MGQGDKDSVAAAAQIREWMRSVLAEKAMTPRAWASRAGVAASTVQRAIKDDYAFVTSSRTLTKLATAVGVDPPSVAARPSGTRTHPPRFLPVRHLVQAGHWVEMDDYVQDFLGEYPVAPDPRFAAWPQWLEHVVGDSINLTIPDGAFAHVVSTIDMGYAPRDGDYVVIERRRHGGQLRERTIKQVAINRGVVELWPRSTNPRWNGPVRLNGGAEGEDIEVEIVGLVVGHYKPMA